MIITIDGPSASGKSSAARLLAERLHIYYLYTGLLYRAVAYLLLKKYQEALLIKSDPEAQFIQEQDLAALSVMTYRYEDGRPHIFFHEKDITPFLENDSAIDALSSIVATHAGVRAALLPIQRSIAEQYDVVADGRDCGSIVFPHADYKFYLTASLEERAKRAVERKKGAVDFQAIKAALAERDARDTNRTVAPLKVPDQAIVIDSSLMSLNQTVDVLLKQVQHDHGN